MANKDEQLARGGACNFDTARSGLHDALTGAGALQLLTPPREWFPPEGAGPGLCTKFARFERAVAPSSCQGPEVQCAGCLRRFLCCAAASRVPNSCRGSSRLPSPRIPWTEVMGDAKEAGADTPPAGATAQEGRSLLSQGESEEPSAQVSRSRGGTSRVLGLRTHSAGDGCHGSPRLLAPSPRLPGIPRLQWSGSLCACQLFTLFTLQVILSKSSPCFPLGGNRQVT